MSACLLMDRRLVDEDGDAFGVELGAIVCDLPSVFCRPGAMKQAEQSGKTLLQWYRDLATPSSTAGKVAVASMEAAEKYLPATKVMNTARAKAFANEGLEQLASFRTNLDNLKPAINKRSKDGTVVINAADWNRYNARWYGWMSAVSQGITTRDRMTGELLLPAGSEQVFGADYQIIEDVEATEWDGINFGVVLSLAEESGVEDAFGLAPIVIGGIVVGAVAVAVFMYLTAKELRVASEAVSTAIEKCAEAGVSCTPDVEIKPLGGAGGAILALALVGGIAYGASQLKQRGN